MKNLFILLIICTALLACEKNPGEGGTSVITGQVYEFDLYQNPNTGEWDTIFYKLDIGKDVFIIYSNDDELIYDDKFETDYNGRYRFEYLRKVEYPLYTYADSINNNVEYEYPVFKKVNITSNNSTFNIEDFVIEKNPE